MHDTRNVLDEFKHQPHETIVNALNERGVTLEIGIENTLRDYNMGTIVRTANAFGVRTVHVVGRKQWNKRGAMMTDKYLNIIYYADAAALSAAMQAKGKTVYAVENNVAAQSLTATSLVPKAVLLFGQEGSGISEELLAIADHVVQIDQLGSTRSMNVGVAAGIAMYEWTRQNLQNVL
jgi:tRNA G18 (ribose-2'-O)-methylase SpoU